MLIEMWLHCIRYLFNGKIVEVFYNMCKKNLTFFFAWTKNYMYNKLLIYKKFFFFQSMNAGIKRTDKDFIFGKLIGEGSFSNVSLYIVYTLLLANSRN